MNCENYDTSAGNQTVLTVEGTYTSGDREGITVSHEIDFGTMQIKRNYLYKVRIALEDPAGDTYGKVTHAINVKDWTSGITLAWAGDENLYNNLAAANFTVTGTIEKQWDADGDNLERHIVNPFNAEKSATFYVTSTSTKSGLSLTCPATAVAATVEEGGGYQCTIIPQDNTYNENGEFTQKWAITVRESALILSNSILTFTLRNALNSASSASFEIIGKDIKRNPLWWMSEYYIGQDFLAFDKLNENTNQGYLFTNGATLASKFSYSTTVAYDGWKTFDASTVAVRTLDGTSWHIPTLKEWYSIFPAKTWGFGDNFLTLYTANTVVSEAECVFGYNASTQSGIAAKSYYSASGTGEQWAIRFIGTDYCSAWHWKWIEESDNTKRIEITSVLINVIQEDEISKLADKLAEIKTTEYWDDIMDKYGYAKRKLYITGYSSTSGKTSHPVSERTESNRFATCIATKNSSGTYFYNLNFQKNSWNYPSNNGSNTMCMSVRLFRDK